jgi:hypothetical protein
MNLLNEIVNGKDPGEYLAKELQEVVSPVTSRVDDLSAKLDRIEGLLIKIDASLTLLKPLATFISKIPFFRTN